MRCEACREAFSPFHDGVLGGAEAAEVSSHIDACGGCRGEWESYCRAMRAVAWAGPAEPPGLAARVEQAWRATSPERPVSPGGARMRALGAAVFLVATAGAVIATRGQATSTRSAAPVQRVPEARSEAPSSPEAGVAAPHQPKAAAPGHTVKRTEERLPDGRTRTVVEEDWVEGGVSHHSRSETVR